MTIAVRPLEVAWDNLHTLIPVFPIRTAQQYDRAIDTLNNLLDIVGENENHPLYDLVDILGTLIRAYEESHYPEVDVSGLDVLKYLMDEHNITVADLPELGDKEYVTNVLCGKQQLTVSDVKALSHRFNVSVATFV
jgi:HTH-type transcriptional regulator/antitoxin HigA